MSPRSNSPSRRAAVQPPGLAITAILLIALAVAVCAVTGIDPWSGRGNGLSDRFTYDLEPFQKTDPALVGYRETAKIALPLGDPRAVAVGPDDHVYVAGGGKLCEFRPDGAAVREIPLDGDPYCLAVGGPHHARPGRIYVGMKTHVETFDPSGKREAAWADLGGKALCTSLALGENDVYLADAGGRIVLRFDLAGKLQGRIGARDEARDISGFVIPSPHFDVALGSDSLLRVVNPGGHQVQIYTPEGELRSYWGEASFDIRGFSGCCNPAAIALLPDDRVVTAEKGIPRVKLYTADGQFVCVIAPPETLLANPSQTSETRTEHKLKVLDVAADSRGRVLVLDPGSGSVRVFEEGTKALRH